ncbi:hypothetical protein [Alteromonas oceanisediminis]|uniref:hypothetical protein n=1 Tax=Alteromonas oceanisediminis TaxID=2836180 RepID=UPI001BDA4EC1|nr:hypothetical protein [Alteromonas oceanisediminis]MBT0588170.1 hypothetical protein [Alteromonas oceanisediminis]
MNQIKLDFNKRIGSFYRAGLGVITTSISLAFALLIGFLHIQRTAPLSMGIVGFTLVFLLMAIWFGHLSYRLIFQTSPAHTRLFSPASIIILFSIFGVGALAGIVFRFLTGDFENGFVAVLIFVLLFPLGHYCWGHAKRGSNC